MKNCFVTNIPAPYRISMWNQLTDTLNGSEKKFNVLFMNEIEPNRDWIIDEKFNFEHKIWKMRIFNIRRVYFRFSLSYVLAAIKGNDHIILGCSWNDLNVITIAVLKRLRLTNSKISFWTEANYQTIGARNEGRFKFALRKFVLNSADSWFFIPGEMSLITLKKWGVNCAGRSVSFPNLPHASFDKNINTWVGSQGHRAKITIVARLEEATKGIQNFLESLGTERLKTVDINIIGSGPDKIRYQKFISDNKLSSNIRLLGSLNVDAVIEILKTSDFFALPSFSDPSPLTLVEACKIGLPLLVSNKCGNHFECVADGLNGYVFDPDKKSEIQAAFDELISQKPNWKSFSEKSVAIATKNFDTSFILQRLKEYL